MTDSYQTISESDIDVQNIQDTLVQGAQMLQEEMQQGSPEQQLQQQAQPPEEESTDPRAQEQWGIGGVVKELQSAFLGGVQDTVSSAVTLPERAIDMFNGEMAEEMKTDEGYDAEWDNRFVSKTNPS